MNETNSIRQNAEETLKSVWGQAKGEVSTRLQTVETKTREFAENGRKQVDNLRSQMTVEDILSKTGLQETLVQGIAKGQDSIEKLGLQGDMTQVVALVGKVRGHIETVLKSSAQESSVELEKALARIGELEEEVKTLKGKTATPTSKKPVVKKTAKPVAKKEVASKSVPKKTTPSKKPVASKTAKARS